MAEIIFNFEGTNTIIHCNENDKIKDIIHEFLIKTQNEKNINLLYLYNDTSINKELTFNEQANDLDKNRRKMDIIVVKTEEETNKFKETTSKDLIICPECKENVLIDINNFKLNFHGCKNNHKNNNIILYKYEKTQQKNLNRIICDICKQYNIDKTHNNEFFICNTCNKNICPLCKSTHFKSHIIINYDDKNYICDKHNEPFTQYCKTCKYNICTFCDKSHIDHEIVNFEKISINKEDLISTEINLKNIIDKFRWKIYFIKDLFDKMINILDKYYQINNNIINNYNMNKINFYKLQNLIYLKNNNEKIIEELNNLINNDNISEMLEYSFTNFYNKKGERYLGEIKNGLKEGKGIFYYNNDDKNKRVKYEGDFKKDKPEGKGIMYWSNGNMYEGDFVNEAIEGKGIFYWNNGDRYEGDFKNDKREGKGIYYFNNGSYYEGDFKNGLVEGKGVLYFTNEEKYEGDFKNGKFDGKGIFYYNNGNRYEGEFRNNKRHGKGIKYYKNGKKKEGLWKNDEFEGN